MRFDLSIMTDVSGHRSTIWSWTLDLEPASALALCTGAAIALILGVVLVVRRARMSVDQD